MNDALVSVVLPIYGVEKYLDRSINSIVNQAYSNLEILLIDDGSPDNCPAMCDEWALRDSRIKVIHKQNAGLGMARNTGIENATGEYICFFDSDDYVALDTIEKAYAVAKQEKADCVLFGFSNVNGSGVVYKTFVPETEKRTYDGSEVQELFLPDLIATGPQSTRRNLCMSACMEMYSMELIRNCNWRFVSERDIISEDVYSLLCLYKHVKRVSVLPEALYFYCENSTSLTHTYRKDRFERICHLHYECVKKACEPGYDPRIIGRFQEVFVSNVIAAMKMIMQADCPEKEKKAEIRKIVRSDYLRKFKWDPALKSESVKRNVFVLFLRMRSFWGCYLLVKLACK